MQRCYPELSKPLNKLAGKIKDNEMSYMNYKANVKGESAHEFPHSCFTCFPINIFLYPQFFLNQIYLLLFDQ